MIHIDDLDTVADLSKEFIYHSPLEDTINNMVEFDAEGRLTFSDIKRNLNQWGINQSDNKLHLKSLAPDNENIKIKTSDGIRYYKLRWKDRDIQTSRFDQK